MQACSLCEVSDFGFVFLHKSQVYISRANANKISYEMRFKKICHSDGVFFLEEKNVCGEIKKGRCQKIICMYGKKVCYTRRFNLFYIQCLIDGKNKKLPDSGRKIIYR